MKSQMTIGKKLYLSCGAALMLTLAVSVLSLQGFNSLGDEMNRMVKVTARKLYLASEISDAQSDMIAAERGMLARAYMKDMATVTKYSQEYGESATKAEKRIDEFIPLTETVEGRQTVTEIKEKIEKAVQLHLDLYRQTSAGNREAATAILKDEVMPRLVA